MMNQLQVMKNVSTNERMDGGGGNSGDDDNDDDNNKSIFPTLVTSFKK